MKRISLWLLGTLCTLSLNAQKIDFNLPGKESQSLEDGYANWALGRTASGEDTFTGNEGNAVSIKVESVEGTEGNAVFCNWWKDGVTRYSKLVSDGIYPIILGSDNNYTWSSSKPMGLKFTISGLSAGKHTLTAYHNNTDGKLSPSYPTVKVVVDGTTLQQGIAQTIRAEKTADAGMSHVQFQVTEGKPVVVEYISEPQEGTTYINTSVAVNALLFDQTNPKTQAANPQPAHQDFHADADSKSITLTWTPAQAATLHHVMVGTDAANLQQVGTTTQPQYTLQQVSNMNTYYWRIDEEDATGTRYEGEVWSFRPRHLAFPGAEGYGRFAIGGRGGSVYHVTSLDDNPSDPQPGTLRYGIVCEKGPRTIVFDVSGYITLKARLTCSDKYVTVAGQTAPGKGIILRGAPFGMNSDGITRFLRIYRGYASTEEEQNRGLDGFGMAGADHAIMDHCTIAWTTDEGFSSRGAKSITLQRTMIAEALNCADHPNYGSGACHGYAATIGGGQGSGVGSFHHNLLAHCEGRNWSLSGGLTGGGAYDGAHDVFNNVVYNWGGRATDGGSHEINFVNNYYRMGEATSQKYLLRLQLEGTGTGTQSAYVSGNIREEKSGTLTQDKLNTTYRYETSGGQVVNWEPFVTAPFFPSYATIESAEEALRNVLSDVGCNMPSPTAHEERIVQETLNKTYTYKGSKTGKKGLIDREADAGGYEEIGSETREADYDSDADGMPNWWEKLHGLDPQVADNNSDANGDGYTALEEYLNWMAEPHYFIQPGASLSIPLSPLFAGYSQAALYSASADKDNYQALINGAVLTVKAAQREETTTIEVTCEEGSHHYTRHINICVSGTGTGITHPTASEQTEHRTAQYTLGGTPVKAPRKGSLIITKGKKVNY